MSARPSALTGLSPLNWWLLKNRLLHMQLMNLSSATSSKNPGNTRFAKKGSLIDSYAPIVRAHLDLFNLNAYICFKGVGSLDRQWNI